jgi:hypothetical protein
MARRATIVSKSGSSSRLWTSREGLTIKVTGDSWTISMIVVTTEQPPSDTVFVAQCNDQGKVVGEVTRFVFPTGGGSK